MLPRLSCNRQLQIIAVMMLGLGIAGCAVVQAAADEFLTSTVESFGSQEESSKSSEPAPSLEPTASLDEVIIGEISTSDERHEHLVRVPAGVRHTIAFISTSSEEQSLEIWEEPLDGGKRRRVRAPIRHSALYEQISPMIPTESAEEMAYSLEVTGAPGEYSLAVTTVTRSPLDFGESVHESLSVESAVAEHQIEVPAGKYFAVYTSLSDSSQIARPTLYLLDKESGKLEFGDWDPVALDGAADSRGSKNLGPFEPAEEDRTFILQTRGAGEEFVVKVLDPMGDPLESDGKPFRGSRESLETVKMHTFTLPAGSEVDLTFQNETSGKQDIRLKGWDNETERITASLMAPVRGQGKLTWSEINARTESTFQLIVIGPPGPYEVRVDPADSGR